jgi:hypothetical protein
MGTSICKWTFRFRASPNLCTKVTAPHCERQEDIHAGDGGHGVEGSVFGKRPRGSISTDVAPDIQGEQPANALLLTCCYRSTGKGPGTTQVWYLGGAQGNVVVNAVNLAGANSWRLVSVGDFNGDG